MVVNKKTVGVSVAAVFPLIECAGVRTLRVLSPGTKLGRYEIRSRLGAGGMGEADLAQDTRLDRRVAVKSLLIQRTTVIGTQHATAFQVSMLL
jgi:hypothetical protein